MIPVRRIQSLLSRCLNAILATDSVLAVKAGPSFHEQHKRRYLHIVASECLSQNNAVCPELTPMVIRRLRLAFCASCDSLRTTTLTHQNQGLLKRRHGRRGERNCSAASGRAMVAQQHAGRLPISLVIIAACIISIRQLDKVCAPLPALPNLHLCSSRAELNGSFLFGGYLFHP